MRPNSGRSPRRPSLSDDKVQRPPRDEPLLHKAVALKASRGAKSPRASHPGLTVRAFWWNNRHLRQSLANPNDQVRLQRAECGTAHQIVVPEQVRCVAYSP
jgi:hypothetical protein